MDSCHQLGLNARLAAGTCRRFAFRARLLDSLGQVAFEFGDWDQSSAPLRRDSCDHGNDATVEPRQADAERLGRLLAAVGKPLDMVSEVESTHGTHGWGLGCVTALSGAFLGLPT